MILDCRDVSFAYDGKIVISNINFIVNDGDYLCIVGENGSGKSTLLKGILRLKSPEGGKINFGFSRNDVGYLPQQNLHHRDFPASVYEVIMSGSVSKMKLFHTSEDKRKAIEKMEKVRISELKNKSFKELSGGQMQRTLLARALMSAEKVLVLDEPVSGLDPIASEEMYSLISDLNNRGMSVIMVSHDINQAVKYATHILHLGKQQLFFGTKEDYLSSEIGKRYFGGDAK